MKIDMKKFEEGKIIVFFRSGVELDEFLKRCKKNGIRWCGGKVATSFNPREDRGIVGGLGIIKTEYGMEWFEEYEVMDYFKYVKEQPEAIMMYQ